MMEKTKESKHLFIIIFAVIAAAVIFMVGMFSTKKTNGNVDKHLELGQQYLSEMEYEAAVAEYLQVVSIDPYNEEANRALLNAASAAKDYANAAGAAERMAVASVELTEEELLLAQEAYEGAGKGEELLGFYSMLYHTNATDAVMENLVLAQAQSRNFTAMENTLTDMEQKGIDTAKYISSAMNVYIQENNVEAIQDLLEICQNNGLADEIAQSYTLYEMITEEKTTDEVLAYLDENDALLNMLDNLGEDETFYIGKYNEEGEMSGKGICFYGYDRYPDTRLYIGDFAEGVRSGRGVAYRDKGYYIVCEWENNLPNGHAEKHMYSDYSIGSLSDGHISEPTTMYDMTGSIIYVCGIPDDSFESGYGYAPNGDYSELYDDPCPASHVYCWDCAMREGD